MPDDEPPWDTSSDVSSEHEVRYGCKQIDKTLFRINHRSGHEDFDQVLGRECGECLCDSKAKRVERSDSRDRLPLHSCVAKHFLK